jgi:hypothetical protein
VIEIETNEIVKIAQGIRFILGHFNEPIYPRRVFTPAEKQVTVFSSSEILKKFIEARFEDCRISAYPYFGQKQHWYLGFQKPDLLFIDLDRNQFRNSIALNRALKKTMKNIKSKLCCYDAVPTILESGSGGYHIIQPLYAPDLKRIDYFTKWSKEPNKDFIRFLEPILSPRADPNHYHNVSLNNCLLRVPGSINGKSKTEVKINQIWNGIRPHIKYVYADFLAYLIDKDNEDMKKDWCSNPHRMNWIEYCNKRETK